MKALTLVLLVLGLGAGLLYFVLDTEGGRGPSPEPPGRRAAGQDRAPTADAPRSQREETAAGDPEARARRQSVEPGVAPGIRLMLEGTVIAEGAALPGASLSLLRHGVLLAEAQTDARGRFRMESGSLTSAGVLRVVARGFVPTERTLAAKPAGGTVMLGNLRLLRGQRLTGRVLDGRNAGVPDAELRVEPISAGSDLLVARGRSGPDGEFEIGDAPPGTVIVSACAKGFGEQSVEHANGAQPLVIVLQPGVDLWFRLHTPRGQPVFGAEVTIQASSDPRAAKRVAESDAEGRVHFEGLGAPTWSVRVTHPEYRPSGKSQVQAGGAEEPIECVPWPAIEGRVRAPGGAAPPQGTRVQALPASAPSERVAQFEGGQEVGPDGSFRLGGLRAGDWRVRVAAPGFAPATSAPVKLGIEGDGHAGTIELQSGGKLELLLLLDAKPVAAAEIEVLTAPPTPAQLWHYSGARVPGSGGRVVSGPDGRATLENLSPGSVWVAIFAEGCAPTSSGPHAVGAAPAQPIAIELARGARLLGRVSRKSGAPFPRAQLRVVERTGLGFPLSFASEPDGSYSSAWLPPGHYTVEAFAPEEPTLRSAPVELDLKAGEQRTLDLEL